MLVDSGDDENDEVLNEDAGLKDDSVEDKDEDLEDQGRNQNEEEGI